MQKVTVVIPNFNGIAYIRKCLDSLRKQDFSDFSVIVVDNGSSDGSRELVREHYPEVRLIALRENLGFCRAVNEGILHSDTPYVLLLNNDTETETGFVRAMYEAMEVRPRAFSCSAKLLQYHERTRMDDAGDFYNALGWAYARGKGKPEEKYSQSCRIFSSCGAAVIYRRSILEQIGIFDEEHFAYLEDMDLGYRARIAGYENWYIPSARVYHIGSATTGSRYNEFKIRYSSRNNIYLIYKNMPILQIILNLPFLAPGFLIKFLFFASRGYAREYLAGIKNGFSISRNGKKAGKKVKFRLSNMKNYAKIQLELWVNLVGRFL